MFIGQFAWDKKQSYLEAFKPEDIKNVTPGSLGLGFKMQNTFSYLSEQQFSPLKASSKYIETKDEVGGFSNGCLLFHLSLLSLLENWGNAVGRRDAACIASQFPFCWWGKGPSIHHGWLECQGQSWLCSCGKVRGQWGTAHKIKTGRIVPRLLHLRAACSKDIFTQPGLHIWVLQGKPPGSVVRPLPRNGVPLPSPLTCLHSWSPALRGFLL